MHGAERDRDGLPGACAGVCDGEVRIVGGETGLGVGWLRWA